MNLANKPLLLAALLLPPALRAAPPELPQWLAEASRGGRYETPASDETGRAEHLFQSLLNGTAPAALAPELAALALDLQSPDDGATLVLREAAGALRGRGFYVLRPALLGPVLQVPHAFKDRLTREIGLQLFAEGRFSAAAWNTVPRWSEEGGRRLDADLAHLPDSYFTAFTRALSKQARRTPILQIHGFDGGKRKNAPAAELDLILSNGSGKSDHRLHRMARCFERTLAVKAAVFPDEVRELGATTNVQARVLREGQRFDFVHLEMNAALRQRLVENREARAAWLSCVTER